MEVTRLTATDAARAARVLGEVRATTLDGRPSSPAPRPAIRESWGRTVRSGIDPDHDFRSDLLGRDEVERRRRTSRLRHVLPVLREGLLSLADTAQHIMMVADADARVLWREGSTAVLRKADGHGLGIGADWREETVGTNGIGTPLVSRRAVQVFSAEHFVRALHPWTCTGAPITDPRDGRLLGAVDISGPLETLHPSTLALVDTVAKLAQARLRDLHLTSLEQLRAVAAPVLARIGGRAVAVDRDGWTAAVTGMPYTSRVALPQSLSPGRCWLPALGLCTVEPLPAGWLIRPTTDPAPAPTATHITLDVSHPRRWTVTVAGCAGSWTHALTPATPNSCTSSPSTAAAAAPPPSRTTCSATPRAPSPSAPRCPAYAATSAPSSTTGRTGSPNGPMSKSASPQPRWTSCRTRWHRGWSGPGGHSG